MTIDQDANVAYGGGQVNQNMEDMRRDQEQKFMDEERNYARQDDPADQM